MFKCETCRKQLRTAQGLKSHITRLHRDINIPVTDESTTVPKVLQEFQPAQSINQVDNNRREETSIVSRLAKIRSSIKILRRIPKGARVITANALADCIEECLKNNCEESWERLLLFSGTCLQVPSSNAGKQVSLSTLVKRNVCFFKDGGVTSGNSGCPNKRYVDKQSSKKKKINGDQLSRKVEAKLAEGDVRGAIRVLCSKDTFAAHNDETFELLRGKHPDHDIPPLYTPEDEGPTFDPLQVTETDVKAAVQSFPAGSAGGIDMLRPQHLKDLLSFSAGNAGLRLNSALTKLCNLMLKGEVPENICPILYGATLCALNKIDGGLRPIAVGCTIRRLVAKMGCHYISNKLGNILQPHQLGFGTRGGAETAAHSARRYLDHPHKEPKILLKIDFKNAFNMIRRDKLLHAVRSHTPELSSFVWQCYRFPSHLSFGEHLLSSKRGVQQGDPLGSALFSIVALPITNSMVSELNIWYLDDVALADTPETVLKDFKTLKSLASEQGLEINTHKCELLFIDNTLDNAPFRKHLQREIPGLKYPTSEDYLLLGAPIKDDAIAGCLESKTRDLELIAQRLATVPAHCAYYILKNSLSIPKLSYLIRCSPTWKNTEKLQVFDNVLKNTLASITNTNLSDDAWDQSSWPVSRGGLGIRQALRIALPAFLASSHSVSEVVRKILPQEVLLTSNVPVLDAMDKWLQLANNVSPPTDKMTSQKSWETIEIDISINRLRERASNPKDMARLNGVTARESGAFLNVVPSVALGTKLEDDPFRMAVGLRLGCNLCETHTCICGARVDETGTHGLSCKKSSGRLSRHAAVNDLIKRALASANIPSNLEPSHLETNNNQRPDGVTLVPWAQGKSLVWDFTCSDSLAPSYLPSTSTEPLHAATRAERNKKIKYEHLSPSHIVTPVAAECLGAFAKDSLQFLHSVGRKITTVTGEKHATTFLLQRISVAIQRGNAAAIMGTIPSGASLDTCLGYL